MLRACTDGPCCAALCRASGFLISLVCPATHPVAAWRRRWDAWARLTQPLYSRVPVAHVAGNHETELQISNDYHTFACGFTLAGH